MHYSHLSFAYPGNYFYKLVKGTFSKNIKIKTLEQFGLWNFSQNWELPTNRGAISLLNCINIDVSNTLSSCECAVTLCCFSVFTSYLLTVCVLEVLCHMLASPGLRGYFCRSNSEELKTQLSSFMTSRSGESNPCTVINLSFANTTKQCSRKKQADILPQRQHFSVTQQKKTLAS